MPQKVTPIAPPATAVATEEVQQLPVYALFPSANNPRRTFDDAALAELQATIAAKGIHTPLIVRPKDVGADVPSYEILAGARRHRVAIALGSPTVPCIVRELDDAQAAEFMLIDNLQRADVHPVEEAEAFDRLFKTLGSVGAVAAKLGKEQSYVAKVLRLNALTLPSRDALRGRLITIDHALLLARLAEAEQNAALKWCLDRNAGSKTSVEQVVANRLTGLERELKDREEGRGSRYVGYQYEPASVLQLKSFIEGQTGIALARAPWSLTDEDYLLPDVGPCSECPKNTSANSPLFGDLIIGEPTCTDGACFAAKTSGFVQIAQRSAGHDESVKPKVLVPQLSWKFSSVKPSIVPNDVKASGAATEIANPAKLLKEGQWVVAKPGSCPNVRAGVTADWQEARWDDKDKLRKPGEMLQVCIAVGCKAHPKDWEKPKAASGNHASPKRDEAAEEALRRERDHIEKVETQIRDKMFDAILGKLDAAKAVQLVADKIYDAAEWRKSLLELMPKVNGLQLEALVIFCSTFERCQEANGYLLMQPGGVKKDREDIFALAKSVGIDGPQFVVDYFRENGIAPLSDRLHPDVVKKAAPAAPKKAPAKAVAKKAVKSVPAKAAAKKGQRAKPATISPEQRKRIADNMKKRWEDNRKKAGTK